MNVYIADHFLMGSEGIVVLNFIASETVMHRCVSMRVKLFSQMFLSCCVTVQTLRSDDIFSPIARVNPLFRDSICLSGGSGVLLP